MPGPLLDPSRYLWFLKRLTRNQFSLCFKSLKKLLSMINFFRHEHQAGCGAGFRKIRQKRFLLTGCEGIQTLDDQEAAFGEGRQRLSGLDNILGRGLISVE